MGVKAMECKRNFADTHDPVFINICMTFKQLSLYPISHRDFIIIAGSKSGLYDYVTVR